jgi:sugar lactone lactonase YvrE
MYVFLVVTLVFTGVFVAYWKGLLGQKKGESTKMMGGAAGLPPPPLVGLGNASVTTLAGPLPSTATASDGGWVDGQGREARFDGPSAIAADASGGLWVTDSRNHRLRGISPDGTVTTLAGSGPGSTAVGACVDGPAATARLWNPSGVATAPDGSVYFADAGNHRVRVVRAGQVRSLAGGDTPLDAFGLPGGGFQDGPGATARFRYPTGIVRRADGVLLVADTGNRRVRAVLPDGTTSTFADLSGAGAKSPCGLALAPDGRVLVADPAAGEVFVISPGRSVAALPGINRDELFWVKPTALAVSPQGVIYVADSGSHAILRIRPGLPPELLAGTVSNPVPSPGFADGTGDKAWFAVPAGLAMDAAGALYVADFGNNAIRKLVVGPELPPHPHKAGAGKSADKGGGARSRRNDRSRNRRSSGGGPPAH